MSTYTSKTFWVNPARAGMIRVQRWGAAHVPGKPRASGDDPYGPAMTLSQEGVNPARAGMIPSRAFASQSKARKPRASGDDPRVGLLVGGQGG